MANKYTGSWEGKSGAEVRTLIQNALNAHDNNIAASINDIAFTQDEENSQKINWSYTTNDGTPHSGSFTIAATSTAIITPNIGDTYKEVFKYGDDLSVPFSYSVTENGIKIGNLVATITATISKMSGSNVVATKAPIDLNNTLKSSSGTDRQGTLTIKGTDLYEGVNQIKFTFSVNYKGLATADIPITVEAINLVLDVTSNDVKSLHTATDNITLYFNNSGTNSSVTNIVYYGDYPAASTTNASLVTTFSLLQKTAADTYPEANSLKTYGRQRLFIQSRVTNYPEILSNIVMLDFISTTDGSNTFSGVCFATKLNVLSVNNDSPKIQAMQYDNINIPIYHYATEDSIVVRTYNSESLGEVPVLTHTDEELPTSLSFNTTFKSAGTFSYSIYNKANPDQSLVISMAVSASDSAITEPAGNVLSLSSNLLTSDVREWVSNGYETTFNNFDWVSNGFINNALVVNNGATAVIKYAPCTTSAYTISFRFKTVNSVTEECLISCMSAGTGFELYTNKAVISNDGVKVSTEFLTDSIHEVTFVSYGNDYQKLMNIYIDGSIQASAEKSALAKHNQDIYITISANDNQLYLYNVNAYKRALSFTEIQSLACLNKTDSNSIIQYIKDNDVFSTNTTTIREGGYGDYVTIDKLPVGARYMVIESYKNESELESQDNEPWKTINGYISDNPEDYKGVRHLVGSIKLVVKTADGSAHPANFYAERGTLSAQGTSSMAYPAKNFRIYFKKAITKTCPYYNETPIKSKAGDFGYTVNFWTGIIPTFNPSIASEGTATSAKYALFKNSYGDSVERDSAKANVFCLKADFAESSGTHNTGFARLANYALTKSTNICPTREYSQLIPQQQAQLDAGSDAITKTDIRTTIDGRPIYLFFKHNGEDDSQAIYYGKYNMNNEKASEDVFGFTGAVDYYNNEVVKNESKNLATLFGDTEGNFNKTHFSYSINDNEYEEDGEFINPNECWEFSNNTFNLTNPPGEYTNLGAFQYPYTPDNSYPLYELYKNYSPFTAKGKDNSLAWFCYSDDNGDYGQAWEYRFPDLEGEGHEYYVNGGRPYLLSSLYKWLYKHNSTLWTGTNKNTMLSEFASQLHLYFNVNFLLKYFVLTKIGGNSDQRIKNCMLSFYCDPHVDNNTNSEYPMGHMRAFYIFYDNDTILGVDNTGALSNPWNMDESYYPGYGKHAIWDNLQACYDYYINGNTTYTAIYNLGKLIESAYRSLRTVLTDDIIYQFLDKDQADQFCDAIYNVDAEIKYYYPLKHMTLLPNATVAQPNRVSNIHGNRKFHRNMWLTKRLTWLDAMYGGVDSLNNYRFSFKVQGAEGTGDSGIIKATTAIDNWRFYLTSASSELDTSPLLKAGEQCSLDMGEISVSDFVNLTGLYACSEIDLTGVITKSYIKDLTRGNALPYLNKFIVNTIDNEIKYFSSEAFRNLVSAEFCPNLTQLYIANISPNKDSGAQYLGDIDLSTLSKLTTIDARQTLVNVILPLSNKLTTVYLEKPTKLTVKNKPNLSVLNINSIEELNYLEIGHGNRITINEQLLQIAVDRLADEEFILNINYGESVISNTELNLLVTIADAVIAGNNRVTVRGTIINPTITVEQQSKFKEAFGSNLIVSTSDSQELELTVSSIILREGEELTVYSNKLLASADNWTWNIVDYGQNATINDLITVVKTDSAITFKAGQSGNNTNNTYTLTVSATHDGNTVTTPNISIQYTALQSITIKAAKDILSQGESTAISVTYTPSTATKGYLIDNATWKFENGSVVNNNFTLNTAANGSVKLELTGITNADGDIIVSNTITILYDRVLASYDSITHEVKDSQSNKSSDTLTWIHQLLFAKYGQGISTITQIKISTLRNIDYANFENIIGNNQEGTLEIIHDLEWMEYLSFSKNEFVFPTTFYFSNLSVPESPNINKVTWNLVNAEKDSYAKITFNSGMKQANIAITSTTTWLPNLQLDFSKCTEITKLYNGNGNVDVNSASINITYTATATSPGPSLFKYPPKLKTLGNLNLNTSGVPEESSGQPSTMFNLIDAQSGSSLSWENTPQSAIYKIDNPVTSNTIQVGLIYGYNVNPASSLVGYSPKNISDTHYTYYKTALVDDESASNKTISLTSVNTIGDFTLAQGSNYTVEISKDVAYISYSAFNAFKGTIRSTDMTDSVCNFMNLKKIGRYAFTALVESLSIKLDSASLATGGIGEYAFSLIDGSSFNHNIYIEGNSQFAYRDTSFGVNKKNKLYISSALNSIMSQATDTYAKLLENVQIYVDNSLIN